MLPEGLEFTVCWLVFDDGSCPTFDYLQTLSGSDADCFGAIVDQMSRLSRSEYLRPPTVTPLKGPAKGSFELRVLSGSSRHYARLPLVYSKQREVILLFGDTKKGGNPPPGFIDRVVQYRKLINNGKATYGPIDFKQFN
jgi:hypothetical protein